MASFIRLSVVLVHGQGFALTASRFREVDCVFRLVRGRR